jgi:hypothetical protein
MKIASQGPAVLEVDFGRKHEDLDIEPPHLMEIEAALEAGGVFRWPRTLGSVYLTPDHGRRDLEVTCRDGRSHKVSFYDAESPELLAEQGASPEYIRQSRGFLKIWIMIRGLFADKEALDTRAEDRAFLEQ